MTLILGLASFLFIAFGGFYLIVSFFPADPANQKIRSIIQLVIIAVYFVLVVVSWLPAYVEADTIFELFPLWWESLLNVLSM